LKISGDSVAPEMGAGLCKSGEHKQRKEGLLSSVNPVTLSQQGKPFMNPFFLTL
jgi:hypothetical protein